MSRRPGRACRAARRALPLRHYGALAEREERALARHLAACPACAGEWEALRKMLVAAGPATVFPRESEVDWDRFARATVERARAAAVAPRWPVPFRLPALWAGLAAAAVVVAALWTLSFPTRPGGDRIALAPPGGGLTAESARESARMIEDRLARRSAARYLSDSRSLLLSLVQSPARCRRSGGDVDVSLEVERSRQLLRRQNLYEGDLEGLRDQRLAFLLRQLESVLMQVASLQDCASEGQIRDLREQIEQRQILLRIDLVAREIGGRTHVV